MATYVILAKFTEQGIRNIGQTGERRKAAEQWAAAHGGRLVEVYYTLGRYDLIIVAELPGEDVALEFGFQIGSLGNIRTETLRAFSGEEAAAIAQRIST